MSEISQEKSIQKDNQNSPSSKPSTEKTTSKSFQSEAISTIQNSADSKDFLSNSNLNNLNSLFPSKSKNKENIPQQKTLNNFVIDDNNNKNKKNNIEQNAKGEEKENNLQKDEKQENLEKYENLFLQKKRLMKKSDIVLKNKLLKKLAKNYFDKEAELGSDNEEHDEVVKKVYHSDSDSEKENDKNANDIENLIDNEQKEDYVQNKKFFDDMIERDHEEILQVIEGPKKRIVKEAPKKIVIDDNGLSLKVRMERMNDINLLKEEEDENNEEYKFKNIESKLRQLKKQYNEDETNEEIKEMIELNNNKLMKQINIMTGQQNKSFKQHLEENKEILKNVIQNDEEDSGKKDDNKNGIIVKGNGAATLGNKKFRPFCGMGKFGNCKNSLLNHIKKEKNSNVNNSNDNLNQKCTTSFHSNLKLNSSNEVSYNGNLNEMFFRK
jgi:hypothetical protein